jgi:hypothetical protein
MAASAAAGGHDQQRALILDEIGEVRSHLMDPSLVASSAAAEEPRALAAACYALPAYAREVNREGVPRLWPFGSGYADGRRRDELLLAIGYLIAAFEDHALDAGRPVERPVILRRICRLRGELAGPTPGDPSRSTRSSAVDALAFTGACYALPVYARELGRHAIPLLWPWPRGLYVQHERGLELLLAAAMLLAEIERQDRFAAGGKTAALTAVTGSGQ